MSKVFRVSTYAASNFEWDIIAVIFTATDRLQHFWWNDSLQISEYYKRLDMMLGKYMEYAEIMSADLMVVSDHGFGPCERLVSINRSLEEAGLAVRTESPFSKVLSRAGFTRGRIRNIMGEWPAAFNVLPGPLQDMIRRFVPESAESTMEIDVARSFAYAKTAAGVFLQNGSMRGIVAKKLSELSDKITGDPIVEKVISRDEALQGAYSYRAPDLFLQTRLGYGFSIDKTDLEKGLVGTHRPEGIFMHYRPNSSSNHQELLAPIRPWDVAASILHILKVPVPDYFDGRPKIRRD
jgi:predicted AlkP superfamily phosphohydrolase/phosphomutase